MNFGFDIILTNYIDSMLKFHWIFSKRLADILASILLFCLSDNNSVPIYCVFNMYPAVILYCVTNCQYFSSFLPDNLEVAYK